MAAGLDQGDVREDELGAQLSNPLDQQGAKPLSDEEKAKLAENQPERVAFPVATLACSAEPPNP
jgi:hypothetical protein